MDRDQWGVGNLEQRWDHFYLGEDWGKPCGGKGIWVGPWRMVCHRLLVNVYWESMCFLTFPTFPYKWVGTMWPFLTNGLNSPLVLSISHSIPQSLQWDYLLTSSSAIYNYHFPWTQLSASRKPFLICWSLLILSFIILYRTWNRAYLTRLSVL